MLQYGVKPKLADNYIGRPNNEPIIVVNKTKKSNEKPLMTFMFSACLTVID